MAPLKLIQLLQDRPEFATLLIWAVQVAALIATV